MTFKNTVITASVGLVLSALFACPTAAQYYDCIDDGDCSAIFNGFCYKQMGNCNGPGFCSGRPEACVALWDPVCGCDGKTHSNACDAAADGTSVAYRGECHPPDCLTNSNCPAGRYCAKATGDCIGAGICQYVFWDPWDACSSLWEAPVVCGCDGRSYQNACWAAVRGVNVAYEGACHPPDCTTNAECPASGFCSKAANDCTSAGFCLDRPDACVPTWDPVCGCDGHTYSHTCYAASAGASVAHTGECANFTPTPRTSAISRKTHGTSSLDMDLLHPSGTYPVAVECRTDGPSQILVTFAKPIQGVGGLDPGDVSLSSTGVTNGTVTSVAIQGDTLTIRLTGTSDAAQLTITFPGIEDVDGNAITDAVSLGVLKGDANSDGAVNILDLVTIRNQFNQPVTPVNMRMDVNVDGRINTFDLIAVRDNLNKWVP